MEELFIILGLQPVPATAENVLTAAVAILESLGEWQLAQELENVLKLAAE